MAALLTPLYEATREALWVDTMAPVAAVKVVLLWPTAIVTLAGVVSSELLLLIDTTAAVIAALSSVTVQLIEEFELTAVGLQVSVLNCAGTGAVRLMTAVLLTPL
jgi:hypothetical protein